MFSAEPPLPGLSGLTADALLAGPRGRNLCVSLLDDRLAAPGRRVERAWLDALHAARRGEAVRSSKKLGECVRIADVSGTPFDDIALLTGLIAAVGSAEYWTEPCSEDRGFAGGAAREALRPVAEAVVAAARAPDMRWWTAPVDRGGQRYTQFLGRHELPEPRLSGAAELAGAWLADARVDKRSAPERPEEDSVPYGGQWRSGPALSRVPVTTRALPALGAARLALTEGGFGWRSARCWPVVPQDRAGVYEVRDPGSWAELVGRYPLDVSESRHHDWRRVTGWAGRWLIPDYAAVAADWDAVHVCVAGYLTTAGIAIPVGDGASTMLAGWDPDATWWLTDVLSLAGAPQDWRADRQAPLGWAQAEPVAGTR